MENNKIHYGFGKDYLPNWGIQQALREIYQNFIDYGEYLESFEEQEHLAFVIISNDWIPESLEFLRIGNSKKRNGHAIGKHGEGIKMAFLIMERQGYNSIIWTDKYKITPEFYVDKEIGQCFALNYKEHNIPNQPFMIEFECPIEEFSVFKSNLIVSDDIIFSHYYGDIVNKPQGSIYSGGLFVTKSDNMSNAYNIKPEYLPLDRDRSVPRSFDVNYYSSKINSEHGQLITLKSLSSNDNLYIERIPESVKIKITPKIIGNSVEFAYKDDEGKDNVLTNDDAKQILNKDSFFAAQIKKLKMFIAKQLGLYDLLIEFKKKHVHSADALADFEVILERVNA